MSTINNLANSGYYQLSNTTGGQSGGATTGNSAPVNLTQSLVQALSGSGAGTASNNNDAYMLNLSPAAQQYLQNSGTTATTSTPSLASFLDGGSSGSGNSSPLGGAGTFILSQQQQTGITNILKQFVGQPETQATYDKIQDALNTAGLGTNTLSAQDQARSFDPELVLVNALNGGPADSDSTGQVSASQEQAKSSAYMQGIISQWQNLSGNTSTTAATGTASSTDTQTANAVAAVSSGSGA